jgi:hypothetical protein
MIDSRLRIEKKRRGTDDSTNECNLIFFSPIIQLLSIIMSERRRKKISFAD